MSYIPYPAPYEEAEKSNETILGLGLKSREAFESRNGYGQFGIVQGHIFRFKTAIC